MTRARIAIATGLPGAALALALVAAGLGPWATAADPAADPDAAPADAWPMSRGSLAGTGRSASTLTLPLAEAWRRDFDKTAFAAGPVVAGGMVYVGDLDGGFHALDLATGETRWTRRIDGAGFTSSAALAADPALPLVVGDDLGIVRGNQDFGAGIPEDLLIENVQRGSHIRPDDPDPSDDESNHPRIEQTAHLRHDLRQV